jgi:glycosylphosphatidylinositol transamidase (GPIT) subunit GPI8
MKLYLSKTHSDEDGPYADEGKLGIIYSSREDIIKLCDFFEKVRNELTEQENIHMHFRDSFDDWNRENYIDIEVNVENQNVRKTNI